MNRFAPHHTTWPERPLTEEEKRERILRRYKKYRDSHKKERSEYNKKWYAANKEKTLEKTHAWQRNNRESERERTKKWAKDNPEIVRAMHRKWWDSHPGKALECSMRYRRANPEKRRVHNLVYKAKKRGEITSPSSCSMCGRNGGARIEAHHRNYSKPFDITWLCQKCHAGIRKETEAS